MKSISCFLGRGISRSLILVITVTLFSTPRPARAYFGAKYEPPDGRVLHGLGQYVPLHYSAAENWQFVTDYQNTVGKVPAFHSVYLGAHPIYGPPYNVDLSEVTQNHGYPYLLLIGIGLQDSPFDPHSIDPA